MDTELLSAYLNIKVATPYRGKIKSLFDLAEENAKENLSEKEEILEKYPIPEAFRYYKNKL